MKKEVFAGYNILNFGENHYSCGMQSVVFNSKEVDYKTVANLEGVFLHPTCSPNECDIFAYLGTEEQFKQLYQQCKESQCATIAFKGVGGHPADPNSPLWKTISDRVRELEKEFKPWYD